MLTVLCDFKSTPVQDVVNYIVKRLRELLGDDEKGFRDYFEMLETLSENRNLRANVDEAKQMLTKIEMEKLPSFSWGLNQGLNQGREEIAMRLLPDMDDKRIANFTNISIERVQEVSSSNT